MQIKYFIQKIKLIKYKKSKVSKKQIKMSTIPSQLTSINEKAQRRTIKVSSPSYSKLNTTRSVRKFYTNHLNQKSPESIKRIFNDNEINLQISKQMKQIQNLLQEIHPQLQQIVRKNNERSMMDILFDLQDKIKRKNNLLNQINNQNKQLKSANKKMLRYSQQNDSNQLINPQKQQKTFKLAQELKQQRQALIKIKNQHLIKKNKLQLIKHQVLKLQSQYVERCKKTKQKPLTYEMFKCLNEQKKKQLNNQLQFEQRKRRKRQTLKQMLKSNSFHNTPVRNKAQKNLKQIVNRKKIAEQALKTAKKKYNQEISEFYAKLQFLRQQDSALVATLKQKQLQFLTLQNKFNQTKKYPYHFANNEYHTPHKQKIMMSNTAKINMSQYDLDQTRKVNKKFKYLSTPQQI